MVALGALPFVFGLVFGLVALSAAPFETARQTETGAWESDAAVWLSAAIVCGLLWLLASGSGLALPRRSRRRDPSRRSPMLGTVATLLAFGGIALGLSLFRLLSGLDPYASDPRLYQATGAAAAVAVTLCLAAALLHVIRRRRRKS